MAAVPAAVAAVRQPRDVCFGGITVADYIQFRTPTDGAVPPVALANPLLSHAGNPLNANITKGLLGSWGSEAFGRYVAKHDVPKECNIQAIAKALPKDLWWGAPIEGKRDNERSGEDLVIFIENLASFFRYHMPSIMLGGTPVDLLLHPDMPFLEIIAGDSIWNFTDAQSLLGKEDWANFTAIDEDEVASKQKIIVMREFIYDILSHFCVAGYWFDLVRACPTHPKDGRDIMNAWRSRFKTETEENIQLVVNKMSSKSLQVVGAEDPTVKLNLIQEYWRAVRRSPHSAHHLLHNALVCIEAMFAGNVLWRSWRENGGKTKLKANVKFDVACIEIYDYWRDAHVNWLAEDSTLSVDDVVVGEAGSSGGRKALAGAFKGICFNCGKKGHRSADCLSKKVKGANFKKKSNITVATGAGGCKRCGSDAHKYPSCFANLMKEGIHEKYRKLNLPILPSGVTARKTVSNTFSNKGNQSNVSNLQSNVSHTGKTCSYKHCQGGTSHTSKTCVARLTALNQTSLKSLTKSMKRNAISDSDESSDSDSGDSSSGQNVTFVAKKKKSRSKLKKPKNK